MNKQFYFAGIVNYAGFDHKTIMKIEYEHTGRRYICDKSKYTCNPDIAMEWVDKGHEVLVKSGYWFIKRIAIPTTTSGGIKDWWYISNSGDTYSLLKASPAWRKKHTELSNEYTLGKLNDCI